MHWMQFTPAFLLNDCDFSLKALVAVGDRKPTGSLRMIALIKDYFFSLELSL